MEAMLEKCFEVYKTVTTCTVHSKILVVFREIIQEQKSNNSKFKKEILLHNFCRTQMQYV
jgi:hypothetical protein